MYSPLLVTVSYSICIQYLYKTALKTTSKSRALFGSVDLKPVCQETFTEPPSTTVQHFSSRKKKIKNNVILIFDANSRNSVYCTETLVHRLGVSEGVWVVQTAVHLQMHVVIRKAMYVSISLRTFLRYRSLLLSLSSISSVPHRTAKKTKTKQQQHYNCL